MLVIEKHRKKYLVLINKKLFLKFLFVQSVNNYVFSLNFYSSLLLNKILRMFGMLGSVNKSNCDFY